MAKAGGGSGRRARSKNYLGTIAGLEYFTIDNGNLYRARVGNPIDRSGYRQGARWQAPAHMAKSWYDRIRRA